MTSALSFIGYAVAVAWWAPVLLVRLTASGASVRPGLAAWLSAMASVLTAAALGAAAIARAAAAQWPVLTRLLCHGVAGSACTPQVYRSMAYTAGVTILAILVTLTALVALWRYGRRTQRAVTRTRMHARVALLAGRALPGTGAVVLDDPRPAAYCVAGRPAAIVVTTGALGVLDQAQLAAVLAHERAHLAGGHHLLATATRGLAAAVPRIPPFTAGVGEVTRLTELAADDTAARTAGRRDLVAALLAIATGTAVTGASVPGTAGTAGGVLAAAAQAVPAGIPPPVLPRRRGLAALSAGCRAVVGERGLVQPGQRLGAWERAGCRVEELCEGFVDKFGQRLAVAGLVPAVSRDVERRDGRPGGHVGGRVSRCPVAERRCDGGGQERAFDEFTFLQFRARGDDAA